MQAPPPIDPVRARSEFLARRGHSLRTPLNAILGFAELLLSDDEAPLPPHQREQAQHILSAGERLLLQVQELVDLSRLELGTLALRQQTVDLVAALEGAVAATDAQARQRGIRLEVDTEAAAGARVRGDAGRLQQVFAKLLSNAVRFSPAGSVVRLEARSESGQGVVDVDDSGPGLTAAQRSLLFSPHALAERDAAGLRGSGVGLSVAQGLVSAMAGTLQVLPGPSGGSRMQVRLPALPGS